MKNPNFLSHFRENDEKLHKIVQSRGLLNEERADAFIHALLDISESIEKVYGEIIPKLLKLKDSKDDDFNDVYWEIREEFRHILYHINDADLTEL